MKTLVRRIAVVPALLFAFTAATSATEAAPPEPTGSYAEFEGSIIDLSQGWGEATACAISDSGNYCFRTAAERDDHLANAPQPRAACASALILYDGANKTGATVSFTTRGVSIGLSAYSFANKTSSYKVGACSARFRDSSSILYPGSTGANASANSMASGWDNRVTSVQIS